MLKRLQTESQSQKKLQKILNQIDIPILLAVSLTEFYVYAKEKHHDLGKIPNTIDGFNVNLEIGKKATSKKYNDFYRVASNIKPKVIQ